ncbi:coil containing protein [Vibrio phage 1.215.B._10N.222.54.F7]|nr:coil containing protein [Vibrio phage 1.215.A._10N.222.54.F7]AUR96079.1 coil containing protein [Vibrio phage 1.215.B._10N.222.54.F7]
MLAQLVPKNIKKGDSFYSIAYYEYTDGSTEVSIDEWRVTSIRKKRTFDLDNRAFVTAPRVYLALIEPGVTTDKKTGAILFANLRKAHKEDFTVLGRGGDAPRMPTGYYSTVNKAFEFAIKKSEEYNKTNTRDLAMAVKEGNAENIEFETEALAESKRELKGLKRRFTLYKKKCIKEEEKAARRKEFLKNHGSLFDRKK